MQVINVEEVWPSQQKPDLNEGLIRVLVRAGADEQLVRQRVRLTLRSLNPVTLRNRSAA